MIKIKRQEKNTIFYVCDCGAMGMCSFKPVEKNTAIVIELKCPSCQETERMTLLQYQDEKSKEEMEKNFNNVDLSWVPFVNEELLKGEE